MSLSPMQAARELNVSVQTLRRWSDTFAAVLSPQAHPEAGRKRKYSAGDLVILRHAKTLLDAGKTASEVSAILPTIEVPPAPAPPAPDAQDAALTVPASAAERLLASLSAIADQKSEIARLSAQVDALSERMEAIERASERPQAPRSARDWLRRLLRWP